MKVPVQDHIGLAGFLGDPSTPKQFNVNLQSLAEKVVLFVDRNSWVGKLPQLETLAPEVRAKYEAIRVANLNLIGHQSKVKIEAELTRAHPDESPIVDLLDSDLFKSLSDAQSSAVYAGQPRQDLYQLKFGSLAPFAKEFHYVDQFIHSDLRRTKQNGAWFLLERLIGNKVGAIHLKSGASFDRGELPLGVSENSARKQDFLAIANVASIRERISALKDLYRSDTRVRLSVYRKMKNDEPGVELPYKLPHDRMGYIVLDSLPGICANSPIYFSIGPGVGIFREAEVPYSVSNMQKMQLHEPRYLDEIGETCDLYLDEIF